MVPGSNVEDMGVISKDHRTEPGALYGWGQAAEMGSDPEDPQLFLFTVSTGISVASLAGLARVTCSFRRLRKSQGTQVA